MATTIKLKNGSGAPLAGDLVQGEPALDLTNKRLYTENASGTVIEVGTNPTSLTTGTFTSTGIDDNATSTAITIDASENVGIGTTSPTARIDTRISTTTGKVAEFHNSAGYGIDLTVEGNSGVNTISSEATQALAFATNGSSNERMRIDSSGNVGIGTSSPQQKTHIVGGGLQITGNITTPASGQTGVLIDYASDGARFWSRGTASARGTYSFIQLENDGGSQQTAMFIDTSGNVGIGTTNPLQLLHISKASADNYIRLGSNGANDAGIYFNTGADWTIGTDTSNSNAFDLSNSSTVGGASKVVVTTGGNVGIGTDSPGRLLTVADTGAAIISLQSTDSDNCQIFFGDAASETAGKILYRHGVGAMSFEVESSERMRIDSSGTLLVGKTSTGIGTAGIELTYDNVILGTRNGGTAQYLNRLTSDGNIIEFQKDGTTVGSIASDSGARLKVNSGAVAGYLAVGGTNYYAWNSTDFRGQADGAYNLGASNARFQDLYLSGGAYLGGTGSANHLDDYEEGTWEPALIGISSNPTVTYHSDTGGFYIKVGRLVYVTGTIRTTAYSGGSGNLLIASIPFGVSDRTNGDNSDGVGTALTNLWNGTSGEHPTLVRSKRNDSAFFIAQNSHDAVSTLLDAGDWGSTCMMTFTLMYYTD